MGGEVFITNFAYLTLKTTGLINVPTCFDYWSSAETQHAESFLFFGDDVGSVHCLHFKQPQTLLFKKESMEGLTRVFFMDLDQHRDYVEYRVLDRVHSSRVTRLQYVPRGSRLVSCSEDEAVPLVIRDIHAKLKTYTFQVPKGIQCFDYDRPLNLLVTGGRDCMVRFWNPYVPKQPQAILKGHEVAVLDIRMIPERNIVVSYSGDMVLKTWDLLNHTNLQSLKLKFPIPRRIADSDPGHSAFPLHTDTFQERTVLVACRDYVIQLRLSDDKNEGNLILEPEVLAAIELHCAPTLSVRPRTASLQRPLPVLVPETSTTRYQSESQALEEFGSYVFTKLQQSGDHMTRGEMRTMVECGLPFRALTVSLPGDVHIDPNLRTDGKARAEVECLRTSSTETCPSSGHFLPLSKPPDRLKLPFLSKDHCGRSGSQSSSGGSSYKHFSQK